MLARLFSWILGSERQTSQRAVLTAERCRMDAFAYAIPRAQVVKKAIQKVEGYVSSRAKRGFTTAEIQWPDVYKAFDGEHLSYISLNDAEKDLVRKHFRDQGFNVDPDWMPKQPDWSIQLDWARAPKQV